MTHLETIWHNWQNNKGPCSGCPNNDYDNFWYPFYGMGNKNSDVMIIADTPAYNLENAMPRNCKSLGVERAPLQWQSHSVNSDIFLDKRKNSKKNVLNSVIKAFFDQTEYSIDNVYFTNIKKCGDISGDDKANKQSYRHCSQYMQDEIEEINPNFIISIGSKPFNYIKHKYNLNCSGGILNNHGTVHLLNSKIIYLSLAHWGYYRRNNKMDEYLKEAHHKIVKILNKLNAYT